jgi:NADH-quinone oxidoreductase subunit M
MNQLCLHNYCMNSDSINQFGFPMLSIMLAVPLIGAIWCIFAPGSTEARAQNARMTAIIASTVDLVLGAILWIGYQPDAHTSWQFVEKANLFGRFTWTLGVDGIAVLLIALTVFLTPICILTAWRSISRRVPEFMALFLFVEMLLLGVFMAQDILLFYIMFEGSLIPMYMLVGIWGGERRIYASYKFFLFTLLGSVLMLIGMLYMVQQAGSTYVPTLMAYNFSPASQTWLFFAFFASFAVKMPMWPVHTWLPDTHVEAPTAASVDLAGVMLKLGGYGFLRFSLPMFPIASAKFMWLMFVLASVAVVYTSLIALVQKDMKKLIAYSSVAHMAFVTFGLFSFNQQGIEGAIMVMLGHGLTSASLFLCVGVVYDRLHTRQIDRYGGIATNMPAYATLFLIFTMASIGLPGLSNFPGEFLAMMGTYERSTWAAFFAVTGIITGAAYMLYLYRRVVFGPAKNADAAAMSDLNAREWLILGPIAAAILWMGVYPESFLRPVHADVSRLMARLHPYAPPNDSALKISHAKPAPAAPEGEH